MDTESIMMSVMTRDRGAHETITLLLNMKKISMVMIPNKIERKTRRAGPF